MRYILIFIFSIAVMSAKAQFTGTDSLRNYNNRYITTNPATAFTNNRLNTLLRGIIDFIDTARAGGGGAIQLGIDTVFAVNDSTIRYRKNGVFRQFTLKGVYESRRKVDTIYKSNDTTLTFTVNGTPRTVIIPGGTNLNLATADQTATGNRSHNWNNKWLYLNNIKAFGIYQDQPDANHTNNRFITQFTTDSTINGYPLRLLWGLKNINDDFTDSLRFELASLKGYTYLYHQAAGGAKYATLQLNGDVFAPNVEIYTAGEGKSSYYHFGASASIEPNDSIRLKLQSASTTTKIIGARAESGGVWTPVVIDIPSSGAVLNNVGTGFAWVTTPNGSIKRFNPTYGLTADSSTSNTISLRADTSSTNHLVTQSDLNDALASTVSGINQLTGDVTAGPGTGSQAATIANNAVTDAKLRQSAGLSVIGRSANSTGNVADITAASSNQVLRRSGTSLGFDTLKTQYSVVGNGVGSPFQLTNDASAPGTNKVYGTNASGVKGYQSTTVVNLTSPTNGQILVYQDGEWVNVDNNPVIPESQTAFKVGSSGMAAGDSVYTDAALIGKQVKVYREGERMYVDTVYGIESDTSTGTITFHPYMLTGEKVIIEAGNYSTNTPVITLEDLDFPTQVNLTNTGTTWSATNATSLYNGYGLSNKKLASGQDGYIRARYTTTDGVSAIITFNTSNTNEKYANNPASPTVYNYEAGAFVFSGTLYRLDNNTAAASVGSITVGDYYRIIRAGSTLKLQTSPDASVWTDKYTYSFSSTADLFINANIDANTGANKLFEPKGYNVQ